MKVTFICARSLNKSVRLSDVQALTLVIPNIFPFFLFPFFFFFFLHARSFFAYTFADTEPSCLAVLLLPDFPLALEPDRRAVAFRRSKLLLRLVERGQHRHILENVEHACSSVGRAVSGFNATSCTYSTYAATRESSTASDNQQSLARVSSISYRRYPALCSRVANVREKYPREKKLDRRAYTRIAYT